jgi:hypothetical protein
MGLDRTSPQYAAKARVPPLANDELPELQQFSDIAFLEWQLATSENGHLKNLKYFVSVTISNHMTQRVIDRALMNAHKELEPWPGSVFDADTDKESFAAILGM